LQSEENQGYFQVETHALTQRNNKVFIISAFEKSKNVSEEKTYAIYPEQLVRIASWQGYFLVTFSCLLQLFSDILLGTSNIKMPIGLHVQ
jgi:hypothetical protein